MGHQRTFQLGYRHPAAAAGPGGAVLGRKGQDSVSLQVARLWRAHGCVGVRLDWPLCSLCAMSTIVDALAAFYLIACPMSGQAG